MSITENLDYFNSELAETNARLLAVSKTKPISDIKEAYLAGQRLFGENTVQELTEKYNQLPKDIEWHLIGHLQTNKVKYIVPFVSLIHSVDSLKLLVEIDKQAQKAGRVINCLLEVFIADEESKFGFLPNEIIPLLKSDEFKNLNNIQVLGLMGIASNTDDVGKIDREFAKIKALFEIIKNDISDPKITMTELSIGMSSDYKIALRHGSTLVRIGSAIFGNRNYSA